MTIDAYQRPTVIEVWAPHCSACRAMQPDLDAAADRFGGSVDTVLVNAADDPAAAAALGARGTPTLIGVRDGGEVFRHVGRRTAAELDALFREVMGDGAATGVGGSDVVIRVAGGLALGAVGLVAGPVWPLVGVGAGIVAISLAVWRRSR